MKKNQETHKRSNDAFKINVDMTLNQTKILFVCHGNICRSPACEFVMKDIVNKAGQKDSFVIASAATTEDEIWGGVGNPVYPPMKEVLRQHGLDCEGKRAVLLTRKDYSCYDYLIGMDNENLRDMHYICGGDPDGKMSRLLDWAGVNRSVADPWYTRDFEEAYQDIVIGCRALCQNLCEK